MSKLVADRIVGLYKAGSRAATGSGFGTSHTGHQSSRPRRLIAKVVLISTETIERTRWYLYHFQVAQDLISRPTVIAGTTRDDLTATVTVAQGSVPSNSTISIDFDRSPREKPHLDDLIGSKMTDDRLCRAGNLSLAAVVLAILLSTCNRAEAVVTCAIRWDAWYTNGPADPARYTADALSIKKWHGLAPTHAKFDAEGHITWTPTQATFDNEIETAHKASLCWAYLMYGSTNKIDLSNSMMQGLNLHRSSAIKYKTKYAMMLTTGVIGRSGKYGEATGLAASFLKDENYQFVLVDRVSRPLVFLYYDEADIRSAFSSSTAAAKEALDDFRSRSVMAGTGDPYIVILFDPAARAEEIRRRLGADAISEYVSGRRSPGVHGWSEFEPTIEAEWDAFGLASAGGAVPSLRTGADIRARCETPPPADHRFYKGGLCDNYVETPSNTELITEFRSAASWIARNPAKDPAGLLLVYSWSECDESGNCLMPTYADPDGTKLDVIKRALSER